MEILLLGCWQEVEETLVRSPGEVMWTGDVDKCEKPGEGK
jgi:hypothetical protein